MLDKQDLKDIQTLIDSSVTASEERTQKSIAASEERMQKSIAASEERMQKSIAASVAASEERMQKSIVASEERMQKSIAASEERLQNAIAASEKRAMEEISAAENRWRAFYESVVQPQFQLLAEGHQTLLQTLAPKDRVDNLEEEVIFLKSIVSSLVQQVSELKKAQ